MSKQYVTVFVFCFVILLTAVKELYIFTMIIWPGA